MSLVDLIELRRPIYAAVDAVGHLDWDSDEDLVVLTGEHVRALLRMYERGTVSAAEVRAWAETLECREDVGYEPDHGDELRDFLFESPMTLS